MFLLNVFSRSLSYWHHSVQGVGRYGSNKDFWRWSISYFLEFCFINVFVICPIFCQQSHSHFLCYVIVLGDYRSQESKALYFFERLVSDDEDGCDMWSLGLPFYHKLCLHFYFIFYAKYHFVCSFLCYWKGLLHTLLTSCNKGHIISVSQQWHRFIKY